VKAVVSALAAAALFLPLLASAHLFVVSSPTHGQTFTYGSVQQQAWIVRGPDRHLALRTEFTNDPYVDRDNPRQFDDFTFDFPQVRLGADGRTFYYQSPGNHPIAVAQRYKDFLGIDEIRLLDTAELVVGKPHGYLSLHLLVETDPAVAIASP
jgi:hypothetical protein